MKKIIIYTLLVLFVGTTQAQSQDFLNPFKGFHVGITGQFELIRGSSYKNVHGTMPALSREICSGGQGGIELSYNFANFFGIATGFGVGTDCAIDDWMYDPSVGQRSHIWINFMVQEYEFYVPLKFEFHYPVYKNLYVMAQLSGIFNGFVDNVRNKNEGIINDYVFGDRQDAHYEIHRNSVFPIFDINSAVGLYYQLPYGDLLRLSVGYNYSLTPKWEGTYTYPSLNSDGKVALRHNYVYTQLGYFHTFQFEKAKRRAKKQ